MHGDGAVASEGSRFLKSRLFKTAANGHGRCDVQRIPASFQRKEKHIHGDGAVLADS